MDTLDFDEARVLGCLIEKSMTTPEYYPMTVNALIAACNQRTNREPVVEFDESTVVEALASLDRRGLIGVTRVPGGRALKYAHHAGEALRVDNEQATLLAVLLLRGPQTAAQVRARTERYATFASVQAVEERLGDLMRRDTPLVDRMPREPGRKENRYRCLLVEAGETAAPFRAYDLETRVAALEDALQQVLRRLDAAE
ncbi:MAG: YceH family protein [Acidimicrobiia bacterium]